MLAALLTPPGRGAIAVLHIVGEGSGALVGSLFGRPVAERPRAGTLSSGGEILDEVLVRTVEGFTGEETVEITCHGGKATVERLLAALALPRAGAEELLERGVGTGHLDRIRAEAWHLLPGALTERSAVMLHDQAQGALSRAVEALRSAAEARRLLDTASLGAALARPRRVVIAGLPNAGKSTLFNALVQADRAIVSPEPGTTRDPVREWIAIEGVPLELVDTAGVEEPRDPLERMSIDRTHRALEGADLVLFLWDAQAGPRAEEGRLLDSLRGRRVIVAANKADAGSSFPPGPALPLAARTGQGLADLRRRILQELGAVPGLPEGAPVVFTARQERLLERAVQGGDLDEARGRLLRGPRE
ncbi:MAG TPA: GTPase [Planctomycetota bacterium]|nr:GTPase [Planctomycetota bacterium]